MAAEDILTRLATHFTTKDKGGGGTRQMPDPGTRDIGGQFRTNQPYISGYFQALFNLPSKLTGGAQDSAQKWLHSTVEGFTPHTQTLNKVDIVGQGQIGSSFVASVATTREFTMTFREYQNMPILNIIRLWTAIFDPHSGVAPLGGDEFIPSNYKGSVCVIQTKPVRATTDGYKADDIEELYIYQGVFPTTIPVDTAAASDITGNDTVQLSVTFSFDGAPLTSSEVDKATVVGWYNNIKILNTYDKYQTEGSKFVAAGSTSV
jgi:hypothetical protein